MTRVLLAKQTAAGNSDSFEVRKPKRRPAHFTAFGLANAETVTIQKLQADGTWSNYIDDVTQQMSATKSGVLIYGPGIYRGVKTATAAAVGVEVSTDDSP